ncbi:phosphoribosylglycinamide formyltransferase [Thorsellia kenyensis]|uniref:Phosphoribosylglycinamide formyltransferase n=1 Tax=Thorsellia kenyensis TaxID=1549888 RepID=A0ABV6CAQ1_9GAMM
MTTHSPKKIVVLISGSGSNLKTLIDNCQETHSFHVSEPINANICAVLTNNPSAGGLEFAREANINTHIVKQADFANRALFDEALLEIIQSYSPDLVVLAGYMRILSEQFVEALSGKLINIHPSLLPKYKGLDTHQRVLEANETEHGTSVHFVDTGLDSGPVILQAKVPVFPEDDADILTERVKYQEHQIYPLVVRWFIDGRLKLENNVAYLDGLALGPSGYAP